MGTFLGRMGELLFPPRCVFCDEVVPIGRPGCEGCIAGLSRMSGMLCPVCGKEPRDCVCTPEPFAFARCVSPFAYDGRVRHGIIDLKRSAKSAAIGFFGSEMAARVRLDYGDSTFTCVTYVPAASDSERGFNQAALLAGVIAGHLGLPCIAPPVVKVAGSPAQHTQNFAGRLANAQQGYVLGRGRLSGSVLLVDDVMTTGATLSRCADLMRGAGADVVYCVTASATLRQELPGNLSDIDID